MKRREFLRCLALGLAGGVALSRPHQKLRPAAAAAGEPELRLAFLADAHLKDADPGRPEALALARAVAELRALKPGPDLVLFAGDLAHRGHPGALALGKEILAGLPGPLLMLRGEGDGLPDGDAPWRRLFGEPHFSQVLQKTENRDRKPPFKSWACTPPGVRAPGDRASGWGSPAAIGWPGSLPGWTPKRPSSSSPMPPWTSSIGPGNSGPRTAARWRSCWPASARSFASMGIPIMQGSVARGQGSGKS